MRLGQYVTNGTQLMSLVPADRWIIANYKEGQTAHVAVGQPAVIRVDALNGARLTGHVERLSPAAGSEFAVLKPDNATGNFVKVPQRIGVRIAVDPGQALAARLRPGHVGDHPYRHQRRTMKRLFVFALLAPLASCAAPKADVPPQAAVSPPAGWRGAAVSGDVTAQWWKGFGDPVLTRIVETALADNDDLAIAAARVAEARAQFRFAHAQLMPAIGAVAGGGRDREINPGFGVPEVQTAGEGEVEISYDLDLFGRLADSDKAARAALLAGEAARDNVRLAVAASAAGGYITLCALDARLAVLKDTLAARSEERRVARRRAAAGYSSQLDLAQAEAAYDATEQLIPATELAVTKQGKRPQLLLLV